MRLLHGARAGVVLAFLAASSPAVFAADAPEDAAQKSADAWVKLVDDGQHAESWDAASSLFKAATTRDVWAKTAAAVRASVGKVSSRKLKSREFSKAIPGAPEGEYVTILYDSLFERRPAAVEVVVVHKDKEGWRVAGYVIK
jgi:hypothetical protein